MKKNTARLELLKLQQKIYKSNRRIIEESAITEDRNFKTYENRYLKAVANYKSVSSVEEIESAMARADIIYVGDYHTLNQSQRSLLRVLRSFINKRDDFVLAMEVIQSRHQKYLDAYMTGRLTDKTLLHKIGFREHWFFDLWGNFKPIFDFARENKIAVFGLEASPEEGTSLHKRDVEMARTIAGIYQKNKGKKIFVFVGDLHTAPKHLPSEVSRLFSHDLDPPKTVILYQNSESIYWKLAEKEIEDKIMAVKISENEFCRMHTPPIICQQSYLFWLENEEGILDYSDAKQSFLNYMDQIAQFLGLEVGEKKNEVEVFTCGDLSFLKKLKEEKAFSPKELKAIKRQILHSESYYIPKKKYVYLANVSVNRAAEEATHTLRHLCAGADFVRPMQDSFYAKVLHEALAFFGSKIVNQKRKCLRPQDAQKMIELSRLSGNLRQMALEIKSARLFSEHENSIKKNRLFDDKKITLFSADLFLQLTHDCGYYLGEKMFYGLLEGKLTKAAIVALFLDPMLDKGAPQSRFLELLKKLKILKLPKKV